MKIVLGNANKRDHTEIAADRIDRADKIAESEKASRKAQKAQHGGKRLVEALALFKAQAHIILHGDKRRNTGPEHP